MTITSDSGSAWARPQTYTAGGLTETSPAGESFVTDAGLALAVGIIISLISLIGDAIGRRRRRRQAEQRLRR